MILVHRGKYAFSVEAVAWVVIAIICMLRSWSSYTQASRERAEELRQAAPSRTRLLLARMALRREITRVCFATVFAAIGLVSFASHPEAQPVTTFGVVFEALMFGVLFRLWWTIEMDKRDDAQLTAWYLADNIRLRRSTDPKE